MRLGPYELVTLIGAGGMGEVWAAQRDGGGELLAVKRLPTNLAHNPTYRRFLLDEARLSMLLRHPNIVHVFDAGEAGGEAYIAMEFVHGIDLSRLRRLLDQTGEQIPARIAAYVIGEVLHGLSYAHNLVHRGELISLIHRDVSPHNVILSVQGHVKLTDFGVARLSSEDTSGTHVKGKARYMPPEQLHGESRSPTVDLFAAGAVLHEMLDGRVFRGAAIDDARLLGMAISGEIPPLNRKVGGVLEELRQGLLETNPDLRIASADSALELLRCWPEYGDASAELGALVRRYLEMAAAIAEGETPVQLGHQPTILQPGDDPPRSGLDDLLGSGEFVTAADVLDEPGAPATRELDGGFGPVENIDHVADAARAAARKTGPRRAVAATAPGDDTLSSEPDGSSLGHERTAASFARHVATSPNPIVRPRRRGMIVSVGLGLLGLAGGLWVINEQFGDGNGHVDAEPPPASEGMIKVRVLGDEFAGYAGFHLRGMDKLAAQDILYGFVDVAKTEAKTPLAALAAGDGEFALTTLDQLLLEHARGHVAGKIVAIVDVSVGGDALVLDSAEFPSLHSLADLEALAAKAEHPPVIAHAAATPSEYLDMRLDTLLGSLDAPALGHAGGYADVREAYEALLAPADSNAPVVAALLWEPWITQATAGGLTVAASSRDVPDTIVDVLVASEQVLGERPELVDTLVAAYYGGIRDSQSDPAPLESALVAKLGLSEDEARRTLAGLCLLDGEGARPWLLGGQDQAPLLATAITATWSTLRSHARVEGEAPTLEQLVDTRALLAAAPTNADSPTPGSLAACLEGRKGAADQSLGRLELPNSQTPYFLPGDATLVSERAADVAAIAAALRSFNPHTVSVEILGQGDGGAGKGLGLARAKALVEALERGGITLPMRARAAAPRVSTPTLFTIELSRAR